MANATSTSAVAKTLAWQNCPEVVRLALAGVYSRGASFRRALIAKARNPVAAPAIEIGLDPRPVVYLASEIETKQAGYRGRCILLLVIAGLAYVMDAPTLIYVLILIAAAINGGLHAQRLNEEMGRYSKGKFQLDFAAKLLNSPHAPELDYGIGADEQRVLVHRGFDPFGFAGLSIGKWSFTVDVGRPAVSPTGISKLTTISTDEIEDQIKRDIPRSGFGELIVRDIYTVKGEDASILPMVSRVPDTKQPNVELTEQMLEAVRRVHPDRLRRYILFQDVRWGGELILTHVLRTVLQGRVFYVEASRFVLTPPSKPYRTIDSTNFFGNTRKSGIGSFMEGALLSPFTTIAGAADFFLLRTVNRSVDRVKEEYKKSLDSNPIYNYGSETSIRRQMMDATFDHFSQKADLDFAVKAFDQIVFELIYNYMDAHGVDVSELRNKAMAIYNSGIMVQGDVTAQSIAAGPNATAQTTASSTTQKVAG